MGQHLVIDIESARYATRGGCSDGEGPGRICGRITTNDGPFIIHGEHSRCIEGLIYHAPTHEEIVGGRTTRNFVFCVNSGVKLGTGGYIQIGGAIGARVTRCKQSVVTHLPYFRIGMADGLDRGAGEASRGQSLLFKLPLDGDPYGAIGGTAGATHQEREGNRKEPSTPIQQAHGGPPRGQGTGTLVNSASSSRISSNGVPKRFRG